jgi:pimeloyl-ACP methyl ester carboxylesterase
MSRYVLVHGSWHGRWVWDRLAPMLADAGHDVATPDLPGRGGDPRDPASVTLADQVDAIVQVLEASDRPAIVVGHSFGGFVISHVAERVPERVELLVYLAAFLLQHGQTVLGVATSIPPRVPHLDVREEEGLISVRPEAAPLVFYDDCSPEDARLATERLVPEALSPRRTPAVLTKQRSGSVPRVYVETTNDRALAISLQRRMHAALPCREVVALASSHSPFLSMPGPLAEQLLAWGDDPTQPADGRRTRSA